MPVSAVVGGIGSAIGLGSSIANAVGGGGSAGGFYGGSSPPPAYIPQGQPAADQQYQNLLSALSAINTQQQPFVQNVTQNPYATQAQTGANTAANYGTNTLAPSLANYANILGGAGSGVINTAFDPQGALYARTQQHVLDQSNAVNAMAGLAGTPYGAGVTGQTLGNFNIDWQNQQLARQAQGIQAGGRAFTGAGGLGGTAESLYGTSAALPYTTYQGQQTDALNALLTGQNLDTNTLNALAAYLRLGQSATAVGQAGAAQNFSNNQNIGQQIGQSLSGLAPLAQSLFGPSSPSSSFGNSYASSVDAANASGFFGPTDSSGALLYG